MLIPPCLAFSGDRDRDWDQEWDRERDRDWDLDWDRDRERRGRSRDLGSRDRWPYPRNPRGSMSHARTSLVGVQGHTTPCPSVTPCLFPGLPQRDLSLPLMEKTTFATERERKRRDSVMDYESRSQVCLGLLSFWKGHLHFMAERPFFPRRVCSSTLRIPPGCAEGHFCPAWSPGLSAEVASGWGDSCLLSD